MRRIIFGPSRQHHDVAQAARQGSPPARPSPDAAETGSAGKLPTEAGKNVPLLYFARALRGFGDGFAVIILPAYLSAVGFTPAEIGIVASASLFGTALFTLAVGFIAPRHDLRTFLLAGAALMIATGLAFVNVRQFALLALVAFVGTINPSTGDIGVLIPIEHAMLSRNAPDDRRTRTFARYSLIGALSMAAGSLAAAAPDLLRRFGLDAIAGYELMFYLYAAFGLASAGVYAVLPHAKMHERAAAPLAQSRRVVYTLAALFSVDAFAGGFVVQSLMVLWLFQRFDMSLTAASMFFFWTSVFSAFSYPVAARIADRIGLVNTMVFTHIPSSVLLILVPFAPDLATSVALLLVRSALSQMDVPTRSSFVMAVVPASARAAAAGVTSVPRSLASASSPLLAGYLLGFSAFGWPLVLAGALKIAYDLLFLVLFRRKAAMR